MAREFNFSSSSSFGSRGVASRSISHEGLCGKKQQYGTCNQGVIYVKPYGEDEPIRQGDIVSFSTGDVMVTHRIVYVDQEEGVVTTKGDANQVHDSAPVPFDAILGKVRFHIPEIGYLLLR